MGCHDNLLKDKETLFFRNSEVFVVLKNDVYKARLKRKDTSVQKEKWDGKITEHSYIVEIPSKGITETISRNNIFPYEIDARKSLMSCEIEQKIPELLENSLTTFFKREDQRNRWNRFLDRVIKSIQKLKV